MIVILIHCFSADIALNDDTLTVCSVEMSMDTTKCNGK